VTRWVERVLLVLGIACLGYYGYIKVEATQFQREQAAAFAQMLAQPPAPAAPQTELRSNERVSADPALLARDVHPQPPERPRQLASRDTSALSQGVLGMLEIPRLRVSAPVLSGEDSRTLSLGVGHLPDTPKPWEGGNSALAAHRDGVFRRLGRIRIGDELWVRTLQGELRYVVRETRIVEPDDLSVLAPTDTDTLTLITCYPFNYVGPAPQRFIVHAMRQGSDTTLRN
jgi:sortase A